MDSRLRSTRMEHKTIHRKGEEPEEMSDEIEVEYYIRVPRHISDLLEDMAKRLDIRVESLIKWAAECLAMEYWRQGIDGRR